MADRPKPTSSKPRQNGTYEVPVLVEPKGGPVPSGVVRNRSLRHLPGKHNQLDHAHGHHGGHHGTSGGGANPHGRATVDRQPGRDPRLNAAGRSVELSHDERNRLRRMIIDAQYGNDNGRSDDGVYRLRRGSENLVSLRHVPGAYVTDDGRPVSGPDDGGDHEVYDAEFDMVLNENGEFDAEPSVRVTLDDLEHIVDELAAASREPTAQSVDTGLGQVDVSTPGPGRIGLRVPTDDGTVDVEFDKKDWKAVWKAIHDSLDQRNLQSVDTANGRIDVQTDNPDALAIGPRAMLFISSEGPPEWSMAAQGDGIKRLYTALLANGRAAGIVRAAEPGDNQLKDYWLHGAGAAKWATWTQLYNHLKKHMADESAKRVAAQWFHDRYGIWPGHQKGQNPAGPG